MAIFKIINIQQLDQKYVCVDGYVLWKYQGTMDDRLYSGTVLQQIGHPAECPSVKRHDAINRVNVNINTPAFKQVSNAIREAINGNV